MENDEYYDDEPVEFKDAKRHSRYLGWGVALAAFGWSLRGSGIDGSAIALAVVDFLLFYGATYATVYLIYFVMPVLFPPKAEPPQRPLPSPPPTETFDATGSQRVRVVNRLVAKNDILLQYQSEVQAARVMGGLETVTVNEITRTTNAKKWADGNPARQLFDALINASFIDYDGDWTDTGNKYSTPPTPVHVPTGGGTNRLQPVATSWQPVAAVGEG